MYAHTHTRVSEFLSCLQCCQKFFPKKAKLHKKAEFYKVATTGIKKELFIFDFDVKKADLAALAVMSV